MGESNQVNMLTSLEHGIKVEGVEQYIELYEKGEIDRNKLYELILDADVVFSDPRTNNK